MSARLEVKILAAVFGPLLFATIVTAVFVYLEPQRYDRICTESGDWVAIYDNGFSAPELVYAFTSFGLILLAIILPILLDKRESQQKQSEFDEKPIFGPKNIG